MTPASGVLPALEDALRPSGIRLRGVARFAAGEGPALEDGGTAGSIVLLGNAGGSIWPAFSAWHGENLVDNPLDTWSKAVVGPIARRLGATAFYPSKPPYMPFQQWAMKAEGLAPSPLGILIHPSYGPWHGYRAALGFSEALEGEAAGAPLDQASICDDCRDKPCLSACPAGAISMSGFAVRPCRAHLVTEEGRALCMVSGCAARNACPVGAQHRYDPAQLRFHMAALFG